MTIDATPTLEIPTIDAVSDQHGKMSLKASFQFVYSQGFAELLETLGASLLISTYPAGELFAFRAHDGGVSMLLRLRSKAMGMAATVTTQVFSRSIPKGSYHELPSHSVDPFFV